MSFINPLKIFSYVILPYLAIFSMGFGSLIICGPLSLIGLYFYRNTIINKLVEINLLIYISLAFLMAYYLFYIPYKPATSQIENYYFFKLFTFCLIALIIPLTASTEKNLTHLVQTFCVGAFCMASATMIATVILKSPPYYGQIIDIRALAHGVIAYGNSPGIANLLAFFGIGFQATLILNQKMRPKFFWFAGVAGMIFLIWAGALLLQRTLFLLVFFIQPLVISTILLLQKFTYKRLLIPAVFLFTYPLIWAIENVFGIALIKRTLNSGAGLLNDPRIQMVKYWLEHFIQAPFDRIEVGPSEFSGLPWFHNFFADIHRVSGFWALLAALILIGFIFYRLICLYRANRELGGFLLAVAIPTFLIMMTSIVPEGEKQPLVLMLLIGSVCERLLYLHRSKKLINHQ